MGWAPGGVCMCVLTWTFCDDTQLDEWCGREDRERESGIREKEKNCHTGRLRKDRLDRHRKEGDKEKKIKGKI